MQASIPRTSISTRRTRSEEHTSELQSQSNLVCRLLLEKKKFDHQNERRLHLDRQLPVVELHQAAQPGNDQRAEADEADGPWNRLLVAPVEVPLRKRQLA